MRYHCEAFIDGGKRIGGFVVEGATMSEALAAAARNIEVAIRPDQHEIRVKQLRKETDAEAQRTDHPLR